MYLTFHGAAQTVTGSKYLLEVDDSKVLIDCGLFQGMKDLRQRNWEPPPFDVKAIDAIVLTHAHIDHIGFLPRVVKFGYRGPVYATPATADLAPVMLFDAARAQEDDAEYANRKHFSKHKPALPLYDHDDVTSALELLRPVPREAWFCAHGPVWCRYHDAGHLLGSAMIEVEIRNRPTPCRLLFSGDVGRYDAPLYHDPVAPPACDYLICESTYGNREHPPESVLDDLAVVVNEAVKRGGVMVVAAFAVGRAQQLIYLLTVLIDQGRIPRLPIYLDSPMSIAATEVYCEHAADHDLTEAQASGARHGLKSSDVHLTPTTEKSKAINEVRGPAVIIASSGMMTGGRILHHLQQRLPDSRNTILLGGFQAIGTRGRSLQDGAKFLRMYGHDVPVRAAVREVSSLSGHAGHSELLRWLEPLPAPRRTFITHGERASAFALADELHRTRGWNTHVPQLGERVAFD
jgi:metallo-beta-lactamase family protein